MNAGKLAANPRISFQISHEHNTYVIYMTAPCSFDEFMDHVMNTLGLDVNQDITLKIVDDEGDPCTVSDQNEFDSVLAPLFMTNCTDIIAHVFCGRPRKPGMLCDGESQTVYRQNARRWNKVYSVQGHRFEGRRPERRVCCQVCDDAIWGLGRGGLRCSECGMFVHKKCHKFLLRQCPKDGVCSKNSPFLQRKASNATDILSAKCMKVVVNSVFKEPAIQKQDEIALYNRPSPLDDFELLKVLGRGSYAKVVQAEHKRTKEVYAIKIVKKTMFLDDEDLDWVQTEKAVFEAASNHPFLVGLHSCFQSQKRLEEGHARFYAAEICLALNYLHERRIVYRDLKLDNVLLDEVGHVKITDFGMCKENLAPTETTNTFCGTPNYTAPEIYRGESYTYAVDFWSLGVLMFEMLAGRSPFPQQGLTDSEDEEEALIDMILHQQIRMPRHFSTRSCSILKGFLDKDPERRLGFKSVVQEGFMDVKQNKFFKNLVDWNALERRQVVPPFRPQIDGSRDYSRFHDDFINEDPRLTPDNPNEILQLDQSEFDGFEYVNPLKLGREDAV